MAIVASVPVAIVASVVIVVIFLVLRKRKSTIVQGTCKRGIKSCECCYFVALKRRDTK